MSETRPSTPGDATGADYSTDATSNTPRENISLSARLEALLFVAAGPVPTSRLANTLGVSQQRVEKALSELSSTYADRGICIQSHQKGVQLTTSPSLAEDVERFLDLERTASLTRAALETLAIIAYQQPVTRPQIDSIRGVNSESSIHTLIRHGLIEDIGRSDAPGRPILYATTPDFLQYFGVSSIEELPPLNTDDLLPAVGLLEANTLNEATDLGADDG